MEDQLRSSNITAVRSASFTHIDGRSGAKHAAPDFVIETDREAQNSGPYKISKLGPRQIADYHHTVFGELGLAKITFGGTPITGHRNEALITDIFWCRSCDLD